MSMKGQVLALIAAFALAVIPQAAFGGSPYSANGFGSLVPDDFGRTRAMGGAGTASVGSFMRGNPGLLGMFPPAYLFRRREMGKHENVSRRG